MKISFRKKDFMYSYDKADPPQLRMHLHNYYELLYFKSGDASYIVENSIYQMSPGDLFITRPDEIHTISFHSDAVYERHFIQISPEYLDDIDYDLLYFINQKPAGKINKISADIVKSYGLEEYFSMIEQYVVNRVPESDTLVKTYIIQMLVKINSALREYSGLFAEQPFADKRIIEIKKYIDEHFSEDLSLEFLCSYFYMSKYHLCRIFKNYTGLTVKEYINTRRITVAKQLIFEGHNMTSVCYDCGYRDYSNFYKTFKHFTDKSPRDFFKSHQNMLTLERAQRE